MKYHHISLKLSATQEAELLQAYIPLQKYLERETSLSSEALDHLQQRLNQTVAEQDDLIAVLQAKQQGGEHHLIQLQHPKQEILNLPWQMALDPLAKQPLGMSQRLYLCQQQTSGTPHTWSSYDSPHPGPLKILIMVASPIDTPYKRVLSYDEEERSILVAIDQIQSQGTTNVEIDFTEDGSLEALQRKLKEDDYHVLHLTCHGSYREGQGYLELEDPVSMRAQSTSAREFAEVLVSRDGYKPPLVVLSACQTAQGQSGSDTSGVAAAVLQQGIPAVVAMSLSVQDSYASQFAAFLYQNLVSQIPLPQSFQQAIQQLNVAERNRTQSIPFQWLLPRLYLNEQVGGLINPHVPAEPLSRKLGTYFSHQALRDKLSHTVAGKQGQYLFIGRREDKRKLLPALFQNETLLLRGQGGLGKSAMAAQLAFRWRLRHSDATVFFFDETTMLLPTIFEELLSKVPRRKRKELKKDLEESEGQEENVEILLEGLSEVSHPLIIFDNLESFQQDKGGAFEEKYQELEKFLQLFTAQASFPIILTARYPLPTISGTCDHALRQASMNDYWKKAQQLSFFELRDQLKQIVPLATAKANTFYELVKLLYESLGGNFRALEFFDALYQQKQAEVQSTLTELEGLRTVVQEALLEGKEEEFDIGSNLVFGELVQSLGTTEKRILQLLLHFEIPVAHLALDLQEKGLDLERTLPLLESLTLIEHQQDLDRRDNTWYLPPLTRQLLHAHQAIQLDPQFQYEKAGDYHWYIHENIFSNLPDLQAAFRAYQQTGRGEKMVRAGTLLTNFFYQADDLIQTYDFGKNTYLQDPTIEDIHFLISLSQASYRIGDYSLALTLLKVQQNQYKKIGDKAGEGTTLNNISSIYQRRGEYETALTFLKQSLDIRREIGDKAGEGTTLNNISQIFK
ncbi:MAG: CHAT domain-containing protein [Bacteroidota bacterium]